MAELITGLYGCICHPYASWDECDHEHNKKLVVGQKVKQRHNGKVGVIHLVNEENKHFCTVKFGPKPSDLHLEHAANLIFIKDEPTGT